MHVHTDCIGPDGSVIVAQWFVACHMNVGAQFFKCFNNCKNFDDHNAPELTTCLKKIPHVDVSNFQKKYSVTVLYVP